jgi:sulfide:quinone oxidoreductase
MSSPSESAGPASMGRARPKVVVLGSSFAGLTTARFIRQHCKDAVDITAIDQNPYLTFVPNIPMEVFEDRDPLVTMLMDVSEIHARDNNTFLNAQVVAIDPDSRKVTIVPSDRPGGAPESVGYDFLVIALGNKLAYENIEGFGDWGDTVSSGYYGNKLRRRLASYKGGPIAIGSALFHQGETARPEWVPVGKAACEGPPLELGLTMAYWLSHHKKGDPSKITLFTPAAMIAEDAGEEIVKPFLEMASRMGMGYLNNTQDISRLTEDGIEFANGQSLEAEIKLIMPDWVPHDFLRELSITDERGFVITDRRMRNPGHQEIFAVGDAAAITVPKLGSLGHQQAEVVARGLAVEVGALAPSEAGPDFQPQILCFGDAGGHKGFYILSDTWYGGKTSVFKMGYAPYFMKLAFKEMYFRTGGKPMSFGVPATEFVMDKLPLP